MIFFKDYFGCACQVYINDVAKDIVSNIRLFVDDASQNVVVENPSLAAELLNSVLEISNTKGKYSYTFYQIYADSRLRSLFIQGKLADFFYIFHIYAC